MSTPALPAILAWTAGTAAALLQLAGALKTAPPLAGLPFDLTLAALALLLPALALLAATRRWWIAPALALPLAAALLLPLWLVVAGSWTASREVMAAKLPEVVLAGPAMLAAGLLVGAEPVARRALDGASLLIGLALAALLAWGLTRGLGRDWAALLPAPGAPRMNYQLAGLALAIAAGLAAVRAAEARGLLRGAAWLALAGGLALAALLPGGRMALLALGLGVAVAPAVGLALAGRRAAALGWLAATLGLGLALGLALLLNPQEAAGLRTLERLTAETAGLEARLGLWAAALDWAGAAAPLGLGTGGFPIAAGHGEDRGLYPHNHALEALAEGGLPGLLLWLGAFGGGAVAALALLRAAPVSAGRAARVAPGRAARIAPGRAARIAPGRAARIAALVLPVAMSAMVSSDLGNRMAWFALGLALSLGVAVAPSTPTLGPRHV